MPPSPIDKLSADLRGKINKLLSEQCLGVLATVDLSGHPYASLVAFASNTDHSELYFVTPRATRKFANLAQDARAALLINNSVNRPADFHEAMAVTVLGRARLLGKEDRFRVLPLYVERHPYLRKFARSPSCAMFAIEVTGLTMVEKFQNVSELKFDHDLDTHS